MPKTVLIADESVTIRSVAESLLRGESFSVHSAGDGQMALELARGEKPDLALIAEKLPGLSGAEICEALKADPELAGMPIIYMRTDQPGQTEVNVDAVLTKPFSPQSLLDTVKRFLMAGEAAGVADSFVAQDEEGLEEELIDQALGLDDVGPLPAEEREVPAPAPDGQTDAVPSSEEVATYSALDEAQPQDGADAVEEPAGSVDPPEDGVAELSSDRPGTETQDELDRALDQAFGASIGETPTEDASASGLQEISLADDASSKQALPEPQDGEPATPPAVHDAGSMTEDLGPELPHDYDWFIKEMEREAGAASGSMPEPPPEPPRIEPLVARDEPATESSSGAPRSDDVPPPPKRNASGEIQIDAGEYESRDKPGYEEFISEFRREIARLEGEPSAADEDMAKDPSKGAVVPAESEAGSAGARSVDDHIRALGDRLIESVSQQVARELVARIDNKVIYGLIEARLKEAQGAQADS
jgi:CheY-like chemotaxis protein